MPRLAAMRVAKLGMSIHKQQPELVQAELPRLVAMRVKYIPLHVCVQRPELSQAEVPRPVAMRVAYLGMSVHKDKSCLKQGCKVGRGEQLIILAHQGKGFKAGLRSFRVQGCHVDQRTHSLPPTSTPEYERLDVRQLSSATQQWDKII